MPQKITELYMEPSRVSRLCSFFLPKQGIKVRWYWKSDNSNVIVLLTLSWLGPRRGNRKEEMRWEYKPSVSSCMKDFSSTTNAASRGMFWIVPNHFEHTGSGNVNLSNQQMVSQVFPQALCCSYTTIISNKLRQSGKGWKGQECRTHSCKAEFE